MGSKKRWFPNRLIQRLLSNRPGLAKRKYCPKVWLAPVVKVWFAGAGKGVGASVLGSEVVCGAPKSPQKYLIVHGNQSLNLDSRNVDSRIGLPAGSPAHGSPELGFPVFPESKSSKLGFPGFGFQELSRGSADMDFLNLWVSTKSHSFYLL